MDHFVTDIQTVHTLQWCITGNHEGSTGLFEIFTLSKSRNLKSSINRVECRAKHTSNQLVIASLIANDLVVDPNKQA